MFDFKLKVFYRAAKRLNFTKAAEELFISQPAVTKHIHEIEQFYKVKLFQRNGTKIKLTQAGLILFKHVEELFRIHREIDFDLTALTENIRGTIRLGASTTVAQYILPKYLAKFKQKYPDIKIELATKNTEHIEQLLEEDKIDLGIIEGHSKRQHLKYIPLTKDELVLCTGIDNPLVGMSTITLKNLLQLPVVIREQGSGSLEVIAAALKKAGIKLTQLNVELVLESTESIKNYLLSSNSFAFLSVHSIVKELKNKELRIVDIKDFTAERFFYFITPQGNNSQAQKSFLKFMSSADHHFQ